MAHRVHIKSGQPYDVYCGRPSEWGNPYSHLNNTSAKYRVNTRDEAVRRHREDVLNSPPRIQRIMEELRGKVLACWCRPDQACHCDIYLEIANKWL